MSKKLQLLEETVSQLENQISSAVRDKNQSYLAGSEARSQEMNHVIANLTE